MIDRGLLDLKKKLDRPLTEEELVEAEELHRKISRISEEEMRKRYY